MFTITGKYNAARVFSDRYDEKAYGQILNLLNQPFVEGAEIVIEPDYHFGAGCTVGFVAKNMSKICPNLLGVDLGCGVNVVALGDRDIDYREFDKVFRRMVPLGRDIHQNKIASFKKIQDLYCYPELRDGGMFERSIGTMGGGNHFGELAKDECGNHFFLVHSGSRNLGKQVAEYYQYRAVQQCKGEADYFTSRNSMIESFKDAGQRKEIGAMLKRFDAEWEARKPIVPEDLAYLEGRELEDYLHDMKIAQEYASLNREVMTQRVLNEYFGRNYDYDYTFESVHNYYNFEDQTMRKGAISANEGELLVIPINMRDGSLLCMGKGNAETLNSAPHGAGRLHGRNEANRLFKLEDFQETMEGIYSTSIGQSTLDESPFAYKPMDDIVEAIEPMAEVLNVIKTVYNIKAGGE